MKTPQLPPETHTDLYLQLSALDQIVSAFHVAMLSEVRLHLLHAMVRQTDFLTLKLQHMHERWQTYLPFHEAVDVKFRDWVEQSDGWIDILSEERKLPWTGFVLDLMGEGVEELSEDLKHDVPIYCAKIDKRIGHSIPDWEERTTGEELDERRRELATMTERAVAAVEELRNKLQELEDYFTSELTPRQFLTLALRLEARDCVGVEKLAKKEIIVAHNAWTDRQVKLRAGEMKDRLRMELMTNTKLEQLEDYVDIDDPQLYEDARFGQYLFLQRHKFTIGDVQQLVKSLEKIRLCNQYIDPKGIIRTKAKNLRGRELESDEVKIVKQLVAFAEKAEWRGGSTSDTITSGIRKMLGVEYNLEGEELAMSNHLWNLLKNRKNCDAEKSLKVTWLNIVGWCVDKGLLSGGAPALCLSFFPKNSPDDYKAIDKGRTHHVATFRKVEPLLERYMK